MATFGAVHLEPCIGLGAGARSSGGPSESVWVGREIRSKRCTVTGSRSRQVVPSYWIYSSICETEWMLNLNRGRAVPARQPLGCVWRLVRTPLYALGHSRDHAADSNDAWDALAVLHHTLSTPILY